MNEHTEQNINEAIDWLQKTGGAIQDFATEQAPMYCQEVVAWTFWSSLIYVIISIVLVALGGFIVYKLVKLVSNNKDWEHNHFDSFMIFLFGGLISLLVGLMMFFSNIDDTIKAKVAPRLVIVEHLRNLK